MKRSSLALATLAGLAACGPTAHHPRQPPPGTSHATPPTCAAIVDHLAIVFGQHDLAPDDRKDLVANCEKDGPSPAERSCVIAAQTPADIDACGKAGPRVPRVADDTAPAPGDPRVDLLALGAAVARYRQELGEPAPAAGPTPVVGLCCTMPCKVDPTEWTGAWQLVRWGLEHPTRWSFSIERPSDDAGAGPAIVRALGCPGEPSYQVPVAAGVAPTAADITEMPAGP